MEVKKELTIDVTLSDLVNSKNALTTLNAIPFKALNGFKVKKIVSAVNAEMAIFEEELKAKQTALFEGVPEGEKPDDASAKEFNDEINEVLGTVVTLNAPMVNLSWFAKTNGAINDDTEWHDFTPAAFQALSWLIVDDIA